MLVPRLPPRRLQEKVQHLYHLAFGMPGGVKYETVGFEISGDIYVEESDEGSCFSLPTIWC